MREKERRCGQPAVNNSKVKIRLAPLPTRNLSIGNSLNLEECLNRSVQMDRPSSRMSDLSNFSGHSMISVARSNYEHQSDELRRSRNRDVIEALRMKDIRRKRPPNYLNENADNRSVDLAFNAKRKRGAYDEEDSELDCLFDKRGKTKFARGLNDNLQIPSRNRFVSAQYKNNEIASSYFSINQPTRGRSMTVGSSMNSNQLAVRHQPGDHAHLNFSPGRVFQQQRPLQEPNDPKKLFKVPSISISNSSSKENANVSNSLSNASISPISRKGDRSAESTSSALFKSLDGSLAVQSAAEKSQRHDASGGLEFMDTCGASPGRHEPQNAVHEKEAAPSITNEKNENEIYKIPEYFHSIDEHIRDENKAKSRLGAFLKAICNVTSPFISRTGAETSDKVANSAAATLTTSASSTITFPAITSTTTTAGSKTMNDSILKLPPLNPSAKLNSTSTPLKVTFNLPSSSTSEKSEAKTDLSSVFKFGQMNSDQQTTKADTATTSTTTAANTSSLFTFGDTADKSKQDSNKTTSMFTLPTSSLSTALSNNKPTFGTGNQETNKTSFALSLPTTTTSFNPAANSSTASSSVFTFGQTATEKPAATTSTQPDANKSTSSIFKFGSEQSTITQTNGSTAAKPAPVFNFGQPSATATNNLNSSKLSSSSFSFGESPTDANSTLLKPATSSAAFTFGADLNKQQQNSTLLPTTASKPASSSSLFSFGNLDTSGTASMFKTPSSTAFQFGSTDSNKPAVPSMPNFSFGAGDKAKESNPLQSSSNNSLMGSNPLLNNSLSGNGAGFKFNLNPSLNSTSNLSTTLTNNNLNNLNNNLNANKSSAGFNFGASSNLTTTFGASSQQTSSTPFKFDASRAQTNPSFNFGGAGSSTASSTPAPSFNFGASTSNPPVFGASTSNNPPVFGASASNPPTFGASTATPPVFGASTNSNPPAFGSIAKDSTFSAPTFNSTGNLFNMGRK